MRIVLSFNDWTMGEIERLESAAGMSLAALGRELAKGDLPARLASALIYASEARTNPDFTLDDARAVRLADLEVSAAATPTGAPAEPGS